MLSERIGTALAVVEEKLRSGEPISRIEVEIIASLMEGWRDQAHALETNGRPVPVATAGTVVITADNVITADFRGRKS